MPQTSDKRKQSLYFPEEMLREIQLEASRQDRSLSWIVQQAWKVSREQLARVPGINSDDGISQPNQGIPPANA